MCVYPKQKYIRCHARFYDGWNYWSTLRLRWFPSFFFSSFFYTFPHKHGWLCVTTQPIKFVFSVKLTHIHIYFMLFFLLGLYKCYTRKFFYVLVFFFYFFVSVHKIYIFLFSFSNLKYFIYTHIHNIYTEKAKNIEEPYKKFSLYTNHSLTPHSFHILSVDIFTFLGFVSYIESVYWFLFYNKHIETKWRKIVVWSRMGWEMGQE